MKSILNITISNNPTEVELFDDTPENRVALMDRLFKLNSEYLSQDTSYFLCKKRFINMEDRRIHFLIPDSETILKAVKVSIVTLDEELKSLEMHHKTACARLEAFYKNDASGKRALTYSTFKEIY